MRKAILLGLLFTASLRLAAAPLSIEEQLRQNLIGSQRILRHFFWPDTLKFDEAGTPKLHGQEGPWTLLGCLQIDDLQLKHDILELHGRRCIVTVDENSKSLRMIKQHERFGIEIATHEGPDQQTQLAAALAQVFVAADDLSSVVPDYWRDYLDRLNGKIIQGEPCADSNTKAENLVTLGKRFLQVSPKDQE